MLADSGYQGLGKWHHASQTPHKKSKHKPLTPQQRRENKELASKRSLCEHIIGTLKRFAILQGPYRNHTKRLALRFNLIAALHNYHL